MNNDDLIIPSTSTINKVDLIIPSTVFLFDLDIIKNTSAYTINGLNILSNDFTDYITYPFSNLSATNKHCLFEFISEKNKSVFYPLNTLHTIKTVIYFIANDPEDYTKFYNVHQNDFITDIDSCTFFFGSEVCDQYLIQAKKVDSNATKLQALFKVKDLGYNPWINYPCKYFTLNNVLDYILIHQKSVFEFTINNDNTPVVFQIDTAGEYNINYNYPSGEWISATTYTYASPGVYKIAISSSQDIGIHSIDFKNYLTNIIELDQVAPLTAVNFANSVYLTVLKNGLFIPNDITDCAKFFYNCNNLQYLPQFFKMPNLAVDCSSAFMDCTSLYKLNDDSFSISYNTENCDYMFYNCCKLSTMISTFIVPASVSSCRYMFGNCLALSGFDHNYFSMSQNAKDISWMFFNCISLTGLPDLDTTRTEVMSGMCANCSSLQYVQSIDTYNCKDFTSSFYNCASLSAIPNFNPITGEIFNSTFEKCTSLTDTYYFTIKYGFPEGTYFRHTFDYCISLPKITSFYIPKAKDATAIFKDCHNLGMIEISGGSSCSSYISSFANCYNLNCQLDLDYKSSLYCNYMFANCSSLITIDNDINTENCINMFYMFGNCNTLISLTSLDTASCRNFAYAFYNCRSLPDLPDLKWNTITNMDATFWNCISLTAVPPISTNNNTIKNQFFNTTFANCISLSTIPEFDFSEARYCYNCFYNCINLTGFHSTEFPHGVSFNGMFYNCYSLSTVSDSFQDFNYTSAGMSYGSMFYNCSALPGNIYLNTNNVKENSELYCTQSPYFDSVFYNCQKLGHVYLTTLTGCYSLKNTFQNCYALTSINFVDNTTYNISSFNHTFDSCKQLTGVSYLDVEKAIDLSYIFTDCFQLTSTDIIHGQNIENLEYSFSNCQKLSSLTFINDNTNLQKCNNFNYTFNNCYNLSSINGFSSGIAPIIKNNFDYTFNNCYNLTSNILMNSSGVTSMDHTFNNCSKVQQIGQFDSSNPPNVNGKLDYTFHNCSSLISNIYINSKNVVSLNNTFTNCQNVNTIDLYNLKNCTNLVSTFTNCYTLNSLNWNDTITPNSNCSYVFNNCYKLPSVPDIILSSATNCYKMFDGCSSLISGKNDTVLTYYLDSCNNSEDMFNNCQALSALSIAHTKTITNMSGMFANCYKLNTFIDGFHVNLDYMCYNCKKLKYVPDLDCKYVKSMNNCFTNCESLTGITLDNTKNVFSMNYAFSNCKNIEFINLHNINIIANLDYAFANCLSLTTITDAFTNNLNTNSNNIKSIEGAFFNCQSLIDKIDMHTDNVTNIQSAFYNCQNIPSIKLTNLNNIHGIRHICYNCTSLTDFTFNDYNTNTLWNSCGDAFRGCSNLSAISPFNINLTYSVWGMFYQCFSLKNLPIFHSYEETSNKKLQYLELACYNCQSLTSDIYVTSDNVVSYRAAFFNCHNLTSINLTTISAASTSSPTDTRYECSSFTGTDEGFDSVFYNCWSLTVCNFLSSFENNINNNLHQLYYTFYNCSSLIGNKINNTICLNTNNLSAMPYTFAGCSKLQNIKINGLSKMQLLRHTFENCSSLISIDGLINTKLELQTTLWLDGAFQNCCNLTGNINISATNIDNLWDAFLNCQKLTNITVNDLTNCRLLAAAFYNCSSCININGLNNISNKLIGSLDYSFYNCNNLITDIKLNTDNISSLNYSFTNCYNVKEITFNSLNQCVSAFRTFTNCHQLSSLNWDGLLNPIHSIDGSLLFNQCYELTEIPNITLEYFKDCSYMFNNCYKLTTISKNSSPNVIDLKTCNTMNSMFTGCSSLTDLTINNTSNVINMSSTFKDCYNLNIKNDIDCTNVSQLNQTFFNCKSLTNLPLKNLNNITTMEGCFYHCENLDIPNFSLNLTNCVNTSYAFSNCYKLTNFALAKDTTFYNIQYIDYMFENCSSLTTLPNISFYAKQCYSFNGVFKGCNNDSTTTLNINSLNTACTGVYEAFANCDKLQSISFTNFNSINVQNAGYLFYNCKNLNTLGSIELNLSNCTNLEYAFTNCEKLSQYNLYIKDGSTKNVSNFNHTFEGTALTIISPNGTNNQSYTLGNLDISSGVTFNYTFANTKITEFKDFNFVNAEQLEGIVSNNRDLTTVSNITIPNTVRSLKYAFAECPKLTTFNLNDSSDLSNVDDFSYMFGGGYYTDWVYNLKTNKVEQIDTKYCPTYDGTTFYSGGDSSLIHFNNANWDMSNTKYIRNMFFGCTNLQSIDYLDFTNINHKYEMDGNLLWYYRNKSPERYPELSAYPLLSGSPYRNIFYGCSALTDITKIKPLSIRYSINLAFTNLGNGPSEKVEGYYTNNTIDQIISGLGPSIDTTTNKEIFVKANTNLFKLLNYLSMENSRFKGYQIPRGWSVRAISDVEIPSSLTSDKPEKNYLSAYAFHNRSTTPLFIW